MNLILLISQKKKELDDKLKNINKKLLQTQQNMSRVKRNCMSSQKKFNYNWQKGISFC